MELKYYTDYSLRVLMYVGTHPNRPVPMREIARAYGISQEHLRKVVHHLAKLGYLHTTRGKSGGIMLGRRPEDIHLGEVVSIMEGSMEIIDCQKEPCPLRDVCILKEAINSAKLAFLDRLNDYTLATLLDSVRIRRRLHLVGEQA